ncbi:hypothetical protein QBC41DRAFT_40029 [Cercophora samala]|uniref:Uncharacterized protein n=1 Tax=Cercophora samala TaxID=330535 RepID=A0AA39YZV4_9PEZI|nr:hypothetical protein QBC41DRAFT_40029 [Cercophora samala]
MLSATQWQRRSRHHALDQDRNLEWIVFQPAIDKPLCAKQLTDNRKSHRCLFTRRTRWDPVFPIQHSIPSHQWFPPFPPFLLPRLIPHLLFGPPGGMPRFAVAFLWRAEFILPTRNRCIVRFSCVMVVASVATWASQPSKSRWCAIPHGFHLFYPAPDMFRPLGPPTVLHRGLSFFTQSGSSRSIACPVIVWTLLVYDLAVLSQICRILSLIRGDNPG